jgi:hypothetical protein
MQIHEITEFRIKEGFLGDLGSVAKGVGKNIFTAAGGGDLGAGDAAKSAAASAATLTAQGYGPGAPKPSESWEDKYKTAQQDPAVKGFAASMAQTWMKYEEKLKKEFSVEPDTEPTTPAKPGEMPTSVANSAQGKKMRQAYGDPSGGIQGMQSDLEEAPEKYTTPGGIVVPAGAKTDQTKATTSTVTPTTTVAPTNQYKEIFKRWADQTLATRVPATGETITMSMVEALPGLSERLSQALTLIEQTQGKPQHAQAIQNYIILASAGVQALAQKSKNQYGTQQTSLGIGSRDLASLKALARTPAGKEMLKQQLGL